MNSFKIWLRPAAALLSAVLVAALFPPFNAAALAWCALVPLLAACWSLQSKRRTLYGFLLGWLGGGVSNLIQFRWLGEVSTLGAVILPLYLGLFWGAFGAYAAGLGNPWRRATLPADPAADRRARRFGIEPASAGSATWASLSTAASHGAVWAGFEWLRGWLFTGFGWNGLGVAFHQTPVLAQAADLLGVAGLSLLVVFFQAVLVQAGSRIWQSARDGRRRPRWDFITAAVVVMAVLAYGLAATTRERARESVRVKALLVQLNTPQDAAQVLVEDLEIHRRYEEDTLAALAALTKENERTLQQAMAQGNEGEVRVRWPDWVVWPESAMRGFILRTPTNRWGVYPEIEDTLNTVREGGRFHLIFGANEITAKDGPDNQIIPLEPAQQYNCLNTISPDGSELVSYRKHHLVIFGETIPFIDTVPLLKSIYEQQSGAEYHGSITPGTSLEPLALPAGNRSIGIIPSVCFEDTVPRLERKFVRPGPQVIVNLTNDGWFRESHAAAQHFANARFRCIELRRPMLRCANTGVSAAVDTTGSTRHPDDPKRDQTIADDHGSHFTRRSLLVELAVPLQPATTLYSLIGDAGIIGLALLALVTSALRRARNNHTPRHQDT